MLNVIRFQEALSQTEDVKRHLLIGNGFSISLFPGRFRYDSLLDSADFSGHPEAREAFNVLGTSDFEVVINALRQAVALLPLYGSEDVARALMARHAQALKELLVQAIAGRHPERPGDVPGEQYAACREFLAQFIGSRREGARDLRGDIYTLNYDLLLYWTLLNTDIASPNDHLETIDHDDGFRAPDRDPEASYVAWDAVAPA